MNEEHELLKSVCREPEDDTVRLVYADWLQENGREDYARYIRASIIVAKVQSGALGPRMEPSYVDAYFTFFEGQKTFLRDWSESHGGKIGGVFERGFAHKVVTTPHRWLEKHEDLVWQPEKPCDCNAARPGIRTRWHCERCNDTGKVPQEFKGTESPITKVVLTRWPGELDPYYGGDVGPWNTIRRYCSGDKTFQTDRWPLITFRIA